MPIAISLSKVYGLLALLHKPKRANRKTLKLEPGDLCGLPKFKRRPKAISAKSREKAKSSIPWDDVYQFPENNHTFFFEGHPLRNCYINLKSIMLLWQDFGSCFHFSFQVKDSMWMFSNSIYKTNSLTWTIFHVHCRHLTIICLRLVLNFYNNPIFIWV